jgi:hypothetical protein
VAFGGGARFLIPSGENLMQVLLDRGLKSVDRSTGGMKIGHDTTAVGYLETTDEGLVDHLKGMAITSGGLVNKLADDTDAELMPNARKYRGLGITRDDLDEIRFPEPLE